MVGQFHTSVFCHGPTCLAMTMALTYVPKQIDLFPGCEKADVSPGNFLVYCSTNSGITIGYYRLYIISQFQVLYTVYILYCLTHISVELIWSQLNPTKLLVYHEIHSKSPQQLRCTVYPILPSPHRAGRWWLPQVIWPAPIGPLPAFIASRPPLLVSTRTAMGTSPQRNLLRDLEDLGGCGSFAGHVLLESITLKLLPWFWRINHLFEKWREN